MDNLQNITLNYTSSYSSFDNISLTSSTLSTPLSPAFPVLRLHQPLLTIIVTLALFLLFGGCLSLLAVCCSSRRSEELEDGGCGLGGDLYCGQSLPSEPQLKLWKRLGSVRRSYSSAPSFRRPPQPSAQSRSLSKLSLQLEQDRRDPQVQLTLPCLLQYATEI
ncbi:uncharacterized protein C10orf105-like [Hoplias malabaricus]|uniref:uncharacterized protein C10orf105-like n=1 Tax=Hoplias malabaricus TaxID=27720 RepID=UPI0034628DA1